MRGSSQKGTDAEADAPNFSEENPQLDLCGGVDTPSFYSIWQLTKDIERLFAKRC